MRRGSVLPVRARSAALTKALIAWAILCTSVGLSITIARLVGARVEAGRAFEPLIQAVVVPALVVPTVVLLRTRCDGKTLAGIGLSRRWLTAAWVGVAVGIGVGVLVWAPAFWVGWVRLDHVDPAALCTFLTVNIVVLVLYEALPEELALRGYGWTTVRDASGTFSATATITLLFCLSSSCISLVQTASALALGVEAAGVSLVPGGSDPIAYLVQILAFGLALIAARRVPLPGALATAIAFHVTQLTVNRVLLGGLGWIGSGVEVAFVAPDAIALVLAHIALSGLLFLFVRLWLERRTSAQALGRRQSARGPRPRAFGTAEGLWRQGPRTRPRQCAPAGGASALVGEMISGPDRRGRGCPARSPAAGSAPRRG